MFNNNLLMGAASAGSGEPLIEIGNSALLSGSTQSLTDTPSSAGNLRDWTFSYWIYYNDVTSSKIIFATGSAPYGNFASYAGSFSMQSHNSSGANHNFIIPDRKFRDNAWYHFVIRCSSTSGDGTAVYDNMNVSIWVNGEPQAVTSVPVNTPTGGPQLFDGGVQTIGNSSSSPNYYVAEMVYLDGQKQNANAFGQYDSTYKFWTPKSPDVIKELTFGTNGFYFDNTTNAQTDASGNGNNYTNNNSVTTSTHTPTNIEFLMSPIFTTIASNVPTLSNGNRTYTDSAAEAQTRIGGNIVFPNSGKWLQGVSLTDKNNGKAFGVWTDYSDGDGFPNFAGLLGWHLTTVMNGYPSSGSSAFTLDTNFTTSDQFWIAVDIDNSKVWLGFYDDSASTITWYAADGGTDGNPATGDNPFESIDCSGMVFAGAAQNSKAFTLVKEADCPFTIPTGYSFLSTTNLASAITRTKSNLEEYFDTTLYEGNGAGQRVGKFLPFTDTFTVGNSALFNKDNSESLSKTPSGAGSSTTTGTFNVWIKQGQSVSSRGPLIYVDGSGSDFQLELNIDGNNKLRSDLSYSGANHVKLSTQAFEDASQWSMVTCILDTSNGTASERIRLYWNSNRLALTTDNAIDQNQAIIIGSAVEHQIGALETSYFYDGYMSEVVYIDGTALEPSNFGQVDTSTGRWIPKDVSGLTFGTNGFYLNFAASDDVGNDVSGNNNDFTNNNTVVQVDDTPTVNFATFDPNRASSSATATIGNTRATVANSQAEIMLTTLPFDGTSKFYAEIHCVSGFNDGGGSGGMVGFADPKTIALSSSTRAYNQLNEAGMGYYYFDGKKYISGAGTAYGSTFTNSDVIGVYVNGNNIYFTKNNTLQNSASEAEVVAGTPTNAFYTDIGGYCLSILGAGGNNPVADIKVSSNDWTHTPFTGFGELSQDNLATGESYQTAFSWIKNRDATDNHMLFDRVRGIYKDVHSNDAAAEVTNVNTLQRFLNGGGQVGNDVEVNTASESYVAWNWYMQTTGSGSSNTDGTINTTSTLVDTNLGLSISEYTGTGANATIGHGLGVAPTFVIIKRYNSAGHNWIVGVNSGPVDFTDRAILQLNQAFADSATEFNDTNPTSSVISLGSSSDTNSSSQPHICYAFAPSQFTSIGSYTGNGNENGPFVPTVNSLGISIQPAWVMIKRTDAANNWCMRDIVRDIDNPNEKELDADLSNAEITNSDLDITTGGFKLRANDNIFNASSGTYVYLAFGTPMIDVDGRIITGF